MTPTELQRLKHKAALVPDLAMLVRRLAYQLWGKAKEDVNRLLAAGRDIAAAHYADPGVTSCPVCGEHHWNEFEVYLCSRCGAEVDAKTKTAGPPAKPEMVRPKLYDGMRVRFVSHDIRGIDGKLKKRDGLWKAGMVSPGATGTVRQYTDVTLWLCWKIDFDEITPKEGCVFGVFGQFLDDNFEELKMKDEPMNEQKVTEPEERLLKWFAYEHLPEHLQIHSQPFHVLATIIVDRIQPGPERTVALRKLLEAKDAAVRAVVHPGG